MKDFLKRLKWIFSPHYKIIGHYTGLTIGCVHGGKKARESVLEEEPESKLVRVLPWKCPICNK
jgi:hypothetical protein